MRRVHHDQVAKESSKTRLQTAHVLYLLSSKLFTTDLTTDFMSELKLKCTKKYTCYKYKYRVLQFTIKLNQYKRRRRSNEKEGSSCTPDRTRYTLNTTFILFSVLEKKICRLQVLVLATNLHTRSIYAWYETAVTADSIATVISALM